MIDPYGDALIAAAYDAEYEHLEADVAWFARHAGHGRLLVLGCGTGRVAGRLASDGRDVVGLDRSSAMLDLARRKRPDVDYVLDDMRSFDVGRVGEIVVPNGGFAFLATRADQARCLAACRRALPEGGLLHIDLPMPAFTQWSQAHSAEQLAWTGLVDQVEVRRTRETRRSIAQQRLDLTDRYYVGDDLRVRTTLALRVMLPGELEWMLEACGFWVDGVVGDYSDGALSDRSPRVLVRAVAG